MIKMGAESSRLSYDGGCRSTADSGTVPVSGGYQAAVNFPNICRREWEAPAWTLLHQCGLDRWKDGHAGQSLVILYVLPVYYGYSTEG